MKTRAQLPNRRRGSVLVVSVIFGAGITMALAGFVALASQATKLSHQSFYANSALNLAEAGLEQALFAINRADWTGWAVHSSGSDNRVKTTGSLDLGQGTVGQIKVVVYGISSSTPRVIGEGLASPRWGPAVQKQVEIKLSRRSLWATGLVAKDMVEFSGNNAAVDSYDSSSELTSTDGRYDYNKRRDRGTVASAKYDATSVNLSNADVWGFVAVKTDKTQFQYRSNASVLGKDSPTSGANYPVDWSRVAYDFSANFDPVTNIPSATNVPGNISGSHTFTGSNNPNAPAIREEVSVSNNNNETTVVSGHLVLVVRNGVTIKGDFYVAPNSSLTLYVAGDVDIGGNGEMNRTGLPQNLIIYGTGTNTVARQQIKLHGNGILTAAVYAPEAILELKGGGNSGEMSGSAVAHQIKVTGNYTFHYDEALAKMGGSNPYAPTGWRELLTAAERVSL